MLTGLFNKIKGEKNKPGPDSANKASGSTGSSPQQQADNSEPKWKSGDTILDRYRIDKVASGAMGKVYLGEHLGWKIPVAIKVPRPEVLADREGTKRILNEANNWVRMGMHPNVATCYYVLTIDKIPHLFIEYVDGGDLSEWIRSGRCRDMRTVLSIAIQFCHGMEFTHAKGVIHRDIKPQNVLITKNALIKITDFGIILTASQQRSPRDQGLSADDTDEEMTVGFRGTPGYASPEQFRDSHTIDERSDIFSFGICLWLMICARKPYKSNAKPEPTEPTPADKKQPFPALLKTILEKTVAPDPDERYRSFAELRRDLNQVHIQLYKTPCPYMDIDFTDLQAENYNNRAVSLFELGHEKEAETCLRQALDINDVLPEAIYNHTLLAWKQGTMKPERLVRRLDATLQRLPSAKILQALNQAIKCDLHTDTWAIDEEEDHQTEKEKFYPEYMLCLPRNSLDVFRESQQHRTNQKNLQKLLAEGKYRTCADTLFKAWEHIGYRKDRVFIKIYDSLIQAASRLGIRTAMRLKVVQGKHDAAGSLTYLPGSKKLLSIDAGGRVLIASFSAKEKHQYLGKYQDVAKLSLSPDKNALAIGSHNGFIHILSMKDGRLAHQFEAVTGISALCFSPDSSQLLVGTGKGEILRLDLNKNTQQKYTTTGSSGISSLAYSSQAGHFFTGSEDGSIRLWEADQQAPIHILSNAHAMPVQHLITANESRFFLSAARDRYLKIWDKMSGQCNHTIEAHDEPVSALLMSDDGQYCISGSEGDIIKIWHIGSGECRLTLDGRSNGIHALCQGPKPHTFFAGSNDGTVICWMIIYDLGFD